MASKTTQIEHARGMSSINHQDRSHRQNANVTPGCQDAAAVSIAEAARQLAVSSATIYRWLRDGFVTGEQLTPGAPWQLRVDQQLRDRVRPQAPDGWLPLGQASSS